MSADEPTLAWSLGTPAGFPARGRLLPIGVAAQHTPPRRGRLSMSPWGSNTLNPGVRCLLRPVRQRSDGRKSPDSDGVARSKYERGLTVFQDPCGRTTSGWEPLAVGRRLCTS